MKKNIRKTIIDIEDQSIDLRNILQSDVSPNFKRMRFMLFFEKLLVLPEQERFRSYYLEHGTLIPPLVHGLASYGWDPKRLLNLLKIIKGFEPFFEDSQELKLITEAREKVLLSTVLSFLYVGDYENALPLLDIESPHDYPLHDEAQSVIRSELDEAKNFLSAISELPSPIIPELKRSIYEWEKSVQIYLHDKVNIILIDDCPEEFDELSSGIFLNLQCSIREKPNFADEDSIQLINQQYSGESSLFSSLQNAITSAKLVIGQSSKIAQRYYSFNFSITETGAEVHGNSIGAAAAVLSYGIMLNEYYHSKIIGFNKTAVVTGGITKDGTFLPIDVQGLEKKITTAFFSPIKRVIVPTENLSKSVLFIEELKAKYAKRHLAIEGVDSLAQVISDRNLIQREKITVVHRAMAGVKRTPIRYYLLGIPSIILLAFYLLHLFNVIEFSKIGQPETYKVLENSLLIYDAEEQLVFSKEFERLTEANYTGKFRNVVIEDIDNDGDRDILFGTFENNNAVLSGNVLCYDHQGIEKWKQHVGDSVRFGNKTYNDEFRIAHISVRDLDKDGQKEILQIGFHWDFPVCVQVSDAAGKILGRYWHVGQLDVVTYKDLDGDGVEEILLGGQNNEYQNAVLVVLDFRFLRGCSPQSSNSIYHPDSLSSGAERYYLKFPHTEFVKLGARDQVKEIQKLKDGILIVVGNAYPPSNSKMTFVHGLVYYELDNTLALITDPTFGDSYGMLLNDQFNMSSHELNMAHYSEILYWDGEDWSLTATMNMKHTK